MSSITCSVRGCYNNWRKRREFLEQECFEHRPKRRWQCCGAPYDIHCPPKDEGDRRMWLKALNLENPPKLPFVCSFHFVDKKPTREHPYPEKWLGYDVPLKTPRRKFARHLTDEEEAPSALTPAGGQHCSTLLSRVEGRKMADYEDVGADENPLLSIRITEVRSIKEETGLVKTREKISVIQTPKEEDDHLEVPLTQPTHLVRPTYEAKPSEDAGVMLLKTPVVWSPHTVKAAVSRLSAVQPAQSRTSPSVPLEKTHENNSDTLPKATVMWSPVAVKAAVNRLSEKHQTQPTQPAQPSPLAADKLPADDALKSTMLTEKCSEKLREERRKEIKVVQDGRYRKSRVLSGPWRQVGVLLLRERYKRLPKALMQVPGFKDHIVAEVLKELEKECETLTSAAFNSALRENNPAALKDFSWDTVIREWKTTAPTFLKFLRRTSKVYENQPLTQKDKSLPMAMGGALLLRTRAPCMCAPQHINSMILRQGRAKKRCVSRLNKLGLCMSSGRSLLRLKDIKKSKAPLKQKPKETYAEMPDIIEENRDSNNEEEDSDVPEITYIVT